MKPFVKWAGGKRQIIDKISEYFEDQPINKQKYIEPFLGGGAVFFSLQPKKAVINDLNEDLMNAYRIIQSDKYEELISELSILQEKYNSTDDREGLYYELRREDRQDGWPNDYSDVHRAARMIFLNRTCYNGLYRVNNKGQFNTPIGRYKNPLICDKSNIREIHNYLEKEDIKIMSGSYEKTIRKARCGDYIYIDPPYDYEDDDGFTKYQMQGFGFEDFKKLKEECDKAIKKGAFVIISNNATQKVIDLFESDNNYKMIYNDVNKFNTLRSINCNGLERKTGSEVIICGMNCELLPQANELNKIVNLLVTGQEAIENKAKAKEVLKVKTDRQVAYYLSALFYLGYIDRKMRINKGYKHIIGNEKEIKKSIRNTILGKEPFVGLNQKYDFLDNDISSEDIIKYLKSKKYDFADSTIKRRASTIKAWIDYVKDNR